MAKINRKLLLLAMLMFISNAIFSQVKFLVNVGAISRNIDAVMNTIVKSSHNTPLNGTIHISIVEERSRNIVMELNSSPIILLQRDNALSSYSRNLRRTFGNNELGRLAHASGIFPVGNFEICFNFIPEDKRLDLQILEQCFDFTVYPRLPIQLIQPEDTICSFRPQFIWQGKKSLQQGSAFNITCVEIKNNQSAEEALLNNIPVAKQLYFQQVSQMPFPSGSKSLISGKKYAWQVTETFGNAIINSSEIYEFIVGCNVESEKTVTSYADLKSTYTGKKYFFTSAIDFSFNNPYNGTTLNYSIMQLSNQTKLKNLPSINMASGLNQISINTEDIKGLIKGEQYKLEVYNLGTTIHYLNFIIKND